MRCWQRTRCEKECGRCGQGLKKVRVGCVNGAQESVEPMVVDALPAAGEVWDGVWTGCTWECRNCDPGRSAGSRRGAKRSVHWVWAGVWEGCEGECGVHLPHTSPTPALFLYLTNKTTNPVLSPVLSPFSSCNSLPTYSTPSPHLPHTCAVPAPHRQNQRPVLSLRRLCAQILQLTTHLFHTFPTPPPQLPSSCTSPTRSTTLWSS